MKARILIAGGYGAVGKNMASLLARRPGIMPVVGGRNTEKAAALAEHLNCEWIWIDLDDTASISNGLKDMDIVINCCIPSDNAPTRLAEAAVEQKVHYLDVSAFNGYCSRVMALDSPAHEKGVTLITALGAYPGIPGLILADAGQYFSEIHAAEFFFVMGGQCKESCAVPETAEISWERRKKPSGHGVKSRCEREKRRETDQADLGN